MTHEILQSIEESEDGKKVNNEIEEWIRAQKLHTVTDASAMNNQMGEFWKIVYFDNHAVTSKEIFNKEWGVNSPKSTEAAIILNILEFVKESTTSQLEG